MPPSVCLPVLRNVTVQQGVWEKPLWKKCYGRIITLAGLQFMPYLAIRQEDQW